MSYLSGKYGDLKMPTEEQRQKLCEMLHRALLEIRILGWQGKSQQAADLADAFHNLPLQLWSEEFSFKFFRIFLESYQEKYPTEMKFNYLAMLNEIMNVE